MKNDNVAQHCPPRNPKKNGEEHPIHINWFPYYAGYNSGFVFDVLKQLQTKPGDSILDPWNGSGTTTTTAYRMGAKVIGCDINPVMVVAAKSALLDPGTAPSLPPLAEELMNVALTSKLSIGSEPLAEWYTPTSANHIRRLHQAIWRVLVDSHSPPSCDAEDVTDLSTIAAFFLTALFRTTRSFLTTFVGSNPTWIRNPRSHRHRVRPSQESVFQVFRQQVSQMSVALEHAMNNGLKEPRHGIAPMLKVASSTTLPVSDGSITTVVTSPPYLTRIDYAVATKPELATLGMSLTSEFKELRNSMVGSPSVRDAQALNKHFPSSCEAFLNAVSKHPSKGSHNYYHKLFMQYFCDMSSSLSEISRVLMRGGTCVLVVQDSYYKEIHANLAQFVIDIACQQELSLVGRNDFEWSRNMVRVNSRSRRYRESSVAVESALWLNKR